MRAPHPPLLPVLLLLVLGVIASGCGSSRTDQTITVLSHVPPFPTASNTGVPAGTSLTPSGPITVTTAGRVLDGLDIAATVTVNAPNVTIRRSRIRSGGGLYAIDARSTGLVVEDVEIDGGGTTTHHGINGYAQVSRVDIHGTENGIAPGDGSVIRDSWIHDLRASGSPHYDGIQVLWGRDITIEHNTIDLSEHDQTAAVYISNDLGPVDNVTVNGNRLLGGGYTVYSDGKNSGHPISNVRFTNNRIGGGRWGYALIRQNATPVVSTGNVDDTTGRAVQR